MICQKIAVPDLKSVFQNCILFYSGFIFLWVKPVRVRSGGPVVIRRAESCVQCAFLLFCVLGNKARKCSLHPFCPPPCRSCIIWLKWAMYLLEVNHLLVIDIMEEVLGQLRSFGWVEGCGVSVKQSCTWLLSPLITPLEGWVCDRGWGKAQLCVKTPHGKC